MHFQLKFAGAALIGGPRRTTDEGWNLFVLLPEGALHRWDDENPPSHYEALNFFIPFSYYYTLTKYRAMVIISKGFSGHESKRTEINNTAPSCPLLWLRGLQLTICCCFWLCLARVGRDGWRVYTYLQSPQQQVTRPTTHGSSGKAQEDTTGEKCGKFNSA